MSTRLTREQVELLTPLSTYDEQQVLLDGTGYVRVYSALAIMIDHDAALREELGQVTGERDEANSRWHYASTHDASLHELEHIRHLQQQLTQAQAENGRLREALNPLVAWAKLVTMDWTADDDTEIDADRAMIDKAQAALDTREEEK